MDSGAKASGRDGSTVLDHWSARKMRPIVLLYVVAVFAVFMVLAYVVFHSREAVKALAIAAVGTVAATVPGLIEKVEYRMTESGIDKRALNPKKPREFAEVFRWDELSHVAPMRHGFRYSKTLTEANPLRRFWKAHFSDRYSGEVHIEREDRDRVLAVVERRGIAVS